MAMDLMFALIGSNSRQQTDPNDEEDYIVRIILPLIKHVKASSTAVPHTAIRVKGLWVSTGTAELTKCLLLNNNILTLTHCKSNSILALSTVTLKIWYGHCTRLHNGAPVLSMYLCFINLLSNPSFIDFDLDTVRQHRPTQYGHAMSIMTQT